MTRRGELIVAVLGLGEAGSRIAADLSAAGAVVRGFDPRVPAASIGIIECAGDADACRGADVVLSLTTAHEALDALTASLPVLSPGAIYADLNTSSSALKKALASLADGAAGARFADVALMAPVPGKGLRTPMLTSGPAAADYARLLSGLGAQVEVGRVYRVWELGVVVPGVTDSPYLLGQRGSLCSKWFVGTCPFPLLVPSG